MKEQITALDWNWAQLLINRALVGQITPNFRRVSLRFEDNTWLITIILRDKISEDEYEYIRDEIALEFADPFGDLEGAISQAALAANHKLKLEYSQEAKLGPYLQGEVIAFDWRQPE